MQKFKLKPVKKTKKHGSFETGRCDERGDRLIQFTEEYHLIIVKNVIWEAKSRYWTWESPEGERKSQTDVTLWNRRGMANIVK